MARRWTSFLVVAALLVAGCATTRTGPTDGGDTAEKTPGLVAGAKTLTDDDILTVDQLRPGMTGYGLTVFAGAKPEKFGVEIISVLRNYEPKIDMILIRCSGHGLEKTGIAAGMSGSPIYINGKLIGALAFGWSFTVEPIAGVQPIRQMLCNSGMNCPLPPATQCDLSMEPCAAGGPTPSGGSADLRGVFSRGGNAKALAQFGPAGRGRLASPQGRELRRLSVPLSISGGSSAAMEFLRQELADTGIVPLRSSGGAGGSADPRMADARIEPGSVLAVPLLTGDMDASAIGTVTAITNDRVLAFGHPMFAEGPVNVPMALGVIHTFIPSMYECFKMGSCGPVVGAIRRDESHSILGVMGQKPFMTPMTVKVNAWDGGQQDVYRYQVADDWFFTARLAAVAALSSLQADHGSPMDLMVQYEGTITFRGMAPYRFAGVCSDPSDMAMRIYGPIRAMYNNRWGKALVESIDLDIRATNERRAANLEKARPEATTLLPGEPFVVHATFEQWKKPRLEKTFTVNLPGDLPDGSYEVTLCDADGYRRLMERHDPRSFNAENMTELLAGFGKMAQPRDDQFYTVVTLPKGGLVGASERLPGLPPSRAAILAQAGREQYRRYTEDVVSAEAMNTIVSGSETFTVTIDRNKEKKK